MQSNDLAGYFDEAESIYSVTEQQTIQWIKSVKHLDLQVTPKYILIDRYFI